MEFFRHLKEGGKGYLLVILFVAGAILLLIAARSDAESTVQDDRIPSADTKKALESELEGLIGGMSGVSYVKVRVTLESGSEYVYENGKNTLVLAGRVRGVAVVCGGGDDPVIKEKVIDMLRALLDLPMKSVSVSE